MLKELFSNTWQFYIKIFSRELVVHNTLIMKYFVREKKLQLHNITLFIYWIVQYLSVLVMELVYVNEVG